MDRKVWKWFVHAERMCGERLTKRVYKLGLKWRWDKGWSCTGFLDSVKNACNARSSQLIDEKVTCMEREQRRDFMIGTISGVNV